MDQRYFHHHLFEASQVPDRPNDPPLPDEQEPEPEGDDIPDTPPTEPPPVPIRDPKPEGQPPGPYVTTRIIGSCA
jgi:hypothetical protein